MQAHTAFLQVFFLLCSQGFFFPCETRDLIFEQFLQYEELGNCHTFALHARLHCLLQSNDDV